MFFGGYFAMKKISLFVAIFFIALLIPFSSCTSDKASLYDISCVYDEDSGSLKGVMNFDWYNDTNDEISVLQFNLYPNAYRKGATYSPVSKIYATSAYYDGESYGEITIDGVDNALAYEIGGEDKNLLFVTLKKPVKNGGGEKIVIRFTTSFAKINHRTGITGKTVNICNFYPVLCAYDDGFYECVYYSDGDPFYSECANYKITFTAPKEYRVASSGCVLKEDSTLEETTYTFFGEKMRDFAMVMSKDFKIESVKNGSVTINYYYYDDDNFENTLKLAKEAMEYFGEKFGEYVYDVYSVVQSEFCFGGMEYPALSIISDSLSEKTTEYTVVHETAHQWWCAMVGNNQCEEAWLDEGLAEYSSLLFFEDNKEYGFDRKGLTDTALSAYRSFYGVYKQIFGETDTSMNRNLGEFISEYEYANISYNKGLIMFDTVRERVGKDAFVSALKNYYSSNVFGIADKDGLISCFKKYGEDLSGIFSSFIDGTAVI